MVTNWNDLDVLDRIERSVGSVESVCCNFHMTFLVDLVAWAPVILCDHINITDRLDLFTLLRLSYVYLRPFYAWKF